MGYTFAAALLKKTATAPGARKAFQDGGKGWEVEFPDAPIFRGVNPASPLAHSARVDAIYGANSHNLCLTFTGGTVKDNELNFSEQTHIWIIPIENPDGVIHHSSPRQRLRFIPKWVDADEKTTD